MLSFFFAVLPLLFGLALSACPDGCVCDFGRTVTVTFVLSGVSVSDFNNNVNNVRTDFIANVVAVVGGSTDAISIMNVSLVTTTSTVPRTTTVAHISTTAVRTVRLVNGPSGCGRVEVLRNGQWGTVCNDFFADPDAKVVCRELGLSGGMAIDPIWGTAFGEGKGPIWMDNVQCSGLEARIEDCRFNGWGIHDCGHYEDIGVCCSSR